MRTIFAEYNSHRNSIDVYTNAVYILRIDCWEAEKDLKTTDSVLHLSATMTSADFYAFSIALCNGYLFQGIPHRPP